MEMNNRSLPPLPRKLRDAVEESLGKFKTLSAIANPGLIFERYPRLWKQDRTEWDVNSRNDFLREFSQEYAASRQSCEPLLQSRIKSLENLSHLFGQGRDYELQWRFVTGMGSEHPLDNGFSFHRLFGVPIFSGSGVKGLVRYVAKLYGIEKDEEERLFGPNIKTAAQEENNPGVGNLHFLDALPVKWPRLGSDIVNNHHTSWLSFINGESKTPSQTVRASAAGMEDPNPVFFLVCEHGLQLRFWIYTWQQSEESKKDVNRAYEWLDTGLQYLGIGAKTAVGYGRFTQHGKKAVMHSEDPFPSTPLTKPVLRKGDRVWFKLTQKSKKGKWQGHLRDYPDSFGTLLGDPPSDATVGSEYEVIVGVGGNLMNLNLRWP